MHWRTDHLAPTALAVTIVACTTTTGDVPTFTCPAFDAGAPTDVSGTFRYSSPLFQLSGTITFEHVGELVRVTNTGYDQHDDRALMGEAPLDGRLLNITLVPVNGDTDYTADVTMEFSPDGSAFCVHSFSDTNGDRGGEGTYTGRRL